MLDLSLTARQFDRVLLVCKDILLKKNSDYGPSWRIMRTSSITDQIFIKAQRIRSLESKGVAKVQEGVIPEWIGIVNYSIMALMQLQNPPAPGAHSEDLAKEKLLELYNAQEAEIKRLMLNKNHDYGEAWRDMRVSSFTDIILMRILRIKQIEDNAGKTLVSEGIEANYQDICNYAVFALIKLGLADDMPSA